LFRQLGTNADFFGPKKQSWYREYSLFTAVNVTETVLALLSALMATKLAAIRELTTNIMYMCSIP